MSAKDCITGALLMGAFATFATAGLVIAAAICAVCVLAWMIAPTWWRG